MDNGASSVRKLLKIVLVVNETSRNESVFRVLFIRREGPAVTIGEGPSAGLEDVEQI